MLPKPAPALRAPHARPPTLLLATVVSVLASTLTVNHLVEARLEREPRRAPSGAARVVDDRHPCPTSRRWVHTFPRDYLGAVHVLVSARDGRTVPEVRLDLLWGRWQWEGTTSLPAGRADRGIGGTELSFAKTGGVVGLNPDVVLVSSIPVCARFGLDSDPRSPRKVVDANPGWVFNEDPLT